MRQHARSISASRNTYKVILFELVLNAHTAANYIRQMVIEACIMSVRLGKRIWG